MSQFDAVVNRLPAPTWNRLRMNEVQVSLPEGKAGTTLIEKNDKITCEEGDALVSRFDAVPTGMGEDIDRYLAGSNKSVTVLTSSSKVDEPVKMKLDLGTAGSRFFVGIEAKEDARITVIMDLKALAGEAEEEALIQTKILAGERSAVRLIQVHRGSGDARVMNDVGSLCQEDARVEIIHVVLGEGDNLIGSRTELKGDRSSLRTDIGYRVAGKSRLDMNYIVNHYGKHTRADIDALGVLRDEGHKLFRGTIDFKKGSKASVGNEKEDVLLMDEGVTNQTIPLILCAEEDVEGNHGATIGQLSEDAMFYLKSRGISEEEGLKLLERGRLASVIRRIPDEETVKELLEVVGEIA